MKDRKDKLMVKRICQILSECGKSYIVESALKNTKITLEDTAIIAGENFFGERKFEGQLISVRDQQSFCFVQQPKKPVVNNYVPRC